MKLNNFEYLRLTNKIIKCTIKNEKFIKIIFKFIVILFVDLIFLMYLFKDF